MAKTLDQERAADTFAAVDHVNRWPRQDRQKDVDRYNTLVHKLPAMIMTNGLGQSLAFLASKAKNKEASPEAVLSKQMGTWVLAQIKPPQSEVPDVPGHKRLLGWVTRTDSIRYRRATVEALAWLVWVKRFAKAELGEPPADTEDDA